MQRLFVNLSMSTAMVLCLASCGGGGQGGSSVGLVKVSALFSAKIDIIFDGFQYKQIKRGWQITSLPVIRVIFERKKIENGEIKIILPVANRLLE